MHIKLNTGSCILINWKPNQFICKNTSFKDKRKTSFKTSIPKKNTFLVQLKIVFTPLYSKTEWSEISKNIFLWLFLNKVSLFWIKFLYSRHREMNDTLFKSLFILLPLKKSQNQNIFLSLLQKLSSIRKMRKIAKICPWPGKVGCFVYLYFSKKY